MLEDLMRLLHAGGTYRVDELARALGTSPEMVTAMLGSLQRLGYLNTVGETCTDACSGCPLVGGCGANAGGKLWTVRRSGDCCHRDARNSQPLRPGNLQHEDRAGGERQKQDRQRGRDETVTDDR
jgi:FeoC like transcriptional regulator